MQSKPMLLRVRKNAVDAKNAREPGYRDAVAAIATEVSDTHYTVPRDAYQQLWRKHSPHRPQITVSRRKPIALGDVVERMLTAVGITKERVQAWTRTRNCGCKARAAWLNQWGYRKQEQLERVLRKAARLYGIT